MSAAPISSPTDFSAVRVIVLADVCLYREGLAAILAANERLVVIAAEPVRGAVPEQIAAAGPAVVLLEAAACETTMVQQLGRLAPATKIVAYGVKDAEPQAV